MDEWVTALAAELGLDVASVDVALLLDAAREAAHGVERPAAPVTTFMIGMAAGLAGGGAEAVRRSAAVAADLARAWPPVSPTRP